MLELCHALNKVNEIPQGLQMLVMRRPCHLSFTLPYFYAIQAMCLLKNTLKFNIFSKTFKIPPCNASTHVHALPLLRSILIIKKKYIFKMKFKKSLKIFPLMGFYTRNARFVWQIHLHLETIQL